MSDYAPRTPFASRLATSLSEGIAALDAGEPLPSTFLVDLPKPPQFDGARIIALRERLGMSLASFAGLLNVSAKTVESWDQGVRKPGGAALRLLQILEGQKGGTGSGARPGHRRRPRRSPES